MVLKLLKGLSVTLSCSLQLIFRVKSAGYDMLKQRGAWQSAGRTHADFSSEFKEFFHHDVEDMLVCLKARSMEEDRARQLLCNTFQVS